MHAGFRVTHLPPVLTSREFEENMPDPHDEADLDVHDTKAVLDAFMLNLSKLADAEYSGLSVLLDSLPPFKFSHGQIDDCCSGERDGSDTRSK